MATNEAKEHLCTVRMSAEEYARAESVADYHGINVSSLVRMLIKREARDLSIEPESAKTTAAKTRAAK